MVSRITDNVDFGAPSQLIMEEIVGGIKGSQRDHGGFNNPLTRPTISREGGGIGFFFGGPLDSHCCGT